MEAFTASLVTYAPTVIVAGVAVLLALVFWRSMRRERPLALGRMLERQGTQPGPVFSREEARKLAQAARRCANCGAVQVCDEYLGEDRPAGQRAAEYAEFCPNADYIEGLRRKAG